MKIGLAGLNTIINWKVAFALNVHATYEDRLPLVNTTDYSFFNKDDSLLPNHPYELASDIPFEKHQALVTGVTLTWQPGQRYIEFPWGKMPLGSDKPTFELEYNKGINRIFGCDIDFDKWKLSMFDNMNFKMAGEFKYRVGVGRFFKQ